MSLLTKTRLLDEVVPPIHALLASQLIDEFVSIERRFVLGDWEPAELDGGQFCEVLSRILYHLDSTNLNLSRDFAECVSYLENDQVPHSLTPRKTYLHIVRVLRTIYKFRSDRGAVHISPTYSPNHMDARLVIENVRWCFGETLRLFWNGDREMVASAIRHLLQFDSPCIGVYENRTIVQRTDMNAEEEILLLLHQAGESGSSRKEIGQNSYYSPPVVTTTLKKLCDSKKRQAIQLESGKYRLTDLGSKRIRDELAGKLRLQ